MNIDTIKKERGKITIQIRNLVMYVMLYLFLQYHGGTLFSNYNNFFKPIVLGLFFLLALNNYKKFKDVNLFLFSLFDAIYIFLISYFNSGETGMSTIAEVIIPIFLAYTLLVVYRQKIFSAYVKIVYIFAGISLLFFLLAQFHPEILLSILKRSVGIKGESFYGGLFYSVRHIWYYDFRNSGMFTEPGLYCVVLLTAIYLLLFQKQFLCFSKNQILLSFIIITSAIITTMSTAGIITLCIILLCYVISRQENKKNRDSSIKKYILAVSLLILTLIIIDYNLNGDSSFIYNNLLKKISSDELVIAGNTGNARLTTIDICIDSIFSYPFGRGKTYIVGLLPDYAVGANALIFIASYGVIFSVYFYWFIFEKFIIDERKKFYTIFSFLILYIVISLAQSMVIYPCFMLVLLAYRMRWIND